MWLKSFSWFYNTLLKLVKQRWRSNKSSHDQYSDLRLVKLNADVRLVIWQSRFNLGRRATFVQIWNKLSADLKLEKKIFENFIVDLRFNGRFSFTARGDFYFRQTPCSYIYHKCSYKYTTAKLVTIHVTWDPRYYSNAII